MPLDNFAEDDLVKIGTSASSAPANGRGQLFIKTFGCQMNEYDSQKVAHLLESKYELTDAPEKADLVIINTCSVRDRPEKKLYSMLGELAEMKQNLRPNLIVGVGGCVAQQEGQRIVKRSKVVDFVYGTHNLSLVPSMIEMRRNGAAPQVAIDYRDEWEDLPPGFSGTGRVSVLVSVSRGCNKNCTYCIVPTTRGPEVSRRLDEILKEVRIAAHRGAREVILLGQTVNSYGLDLSPRISFASLIDSVSQVNGIERIRFISPHPQSVREDFIELVARNPKVCRHIHMPLQSGSDRILKAMNRNYRRQRYLEIIAALRSAVSNIAITTDVIVGFPGETEEDFQATVDVMEQVRFESSYSYMFSARPGTAAAEMQDSVSDADKLARLKSYQARQDQISAEHMQSLVGTQVEVLLEGPSKHNPKQLQGRISQGVTLNLIDIDQSTLEPGMLLQCKVDSVARYTLRGRVLTD